MTGDLGGRIVHLQIYPVKGAAGVLLDDVIPGVVSFTPSGLIYQGHRDHQFMIVHAEPDADGVYRFVTQREKGFSVLACIKPVIQSHLYLTWNHTDHVPVTEITDGIHRRVNVHDGLYTAVDQGDQLGDWLSDHLHAKVRLVSATGPFERLARQNYLANDNPMQFQDGYPLHWFSMASLAELSDRANFDFPWQRFRPQIVVDGIPANEEHRIYEGKFGGVPFVNAKPCERCSVPRVDQVTGELSVDPLRTLGLYKRWTSIDRKQLLVFGESTLPKGIGRIVIGDSLTVTSYDKPAHCTWKAV
jgi:uncharacterized protein